MMLHNGATQRRISAWQRLPCSPRHVRWGEPSAGTERDGRTGDERAERESAAHWPGDAADGPQRVALQVWASRSGGYGRHDYRS